MDKIVIEGGRKLKGQVEVSGAKNAALPVMTACLLASGKSVITNVPELADIQTMSKLLAHVGAEVRNGLRTLKITADKLGKLDAPYDLVRKMRASVLVLGPLVARFGTAKVSLPGGCAIGARPINRHLQALEALGAEIKLEGGYVEATAKKLRGAEITFEDVTVTGTENIMMAATLASGTTILKNAAREPEVSDLADFLNRMGARIEGAGTDTIRIEGVDELKGCEHRIIPDRIEAGTFLIAACMTGGEVSVQGITPSLLPSVLEKLEAAGATIIPGKDFIRIIGPKKLKNVDVETNPFPGFATDFQAQFMALMTLAEGTSQITENIFENRFMHVAELKRMGADITLEGNRAIVRGVEKLLSAPIMATDLRASASLVLAALAADGVTEIHRVYHIDRGYEHIEKKFRNLGARVRRAKVKY